LLLPLLSAFYSITEFKSMEQNSKKISMEIVNPHAAGIDIGSRSHWVAVGQQPEDIKEFGV
jgi:transposase